METLSKIAIVCICLFNGWFLFFVPIEGNYTVNWENEETGMMNITYTSPIPLTKRDTTVQMSKPFVGEVIEHNMYQEDGHTKYITVTKVGNYVYTYNSRQAYEYVRQFKDSLNHVMLQEVFWPSHYVRSYDMGWGLDSSDIFK